MIRDSTRAGAGLLIPAITHFMLRLYVGRTLGQDALGLYSLTWAVYGFALLFGTFGLGAALTRYVAQMGAHQIRRGKLLIIAVGEGLVFSFAAGVLLALVARPVAANVFRMEQFEFFVYVAAAALPGSVMGKIVLGFLNGQRRLGLYAIVAITQSLSAGICTVFSVAAGFGTKGAVAGLLGALAITGGASLALVRRELQLGYETLNGATISRSLTRFGLFVTLINGVGLIQGYTDTLMIGGYLNEFEVGLYAAAHLALEVARFPSQAIQLAVTPRIAALWAASDTTQLTVTVNRALALASIVVLPAVFAAMSGAKQFLAIAFGNAFLEAADSIVLLMIGAIVSGVWAAAGSLLSSTGHVRVAFRISLITAGLNVPLNAMLIPPMGIKGAALATAASAILGSVLQMWTALRLLKLRLAWRRPALAGMFLCVVASTLIVTGFEPQTIAATIAWWAAATAFCYMCLFDRETRYLVQRRLQQWLSR